MRRHRQNICLIAVCRSRDASRVTDGGDSSQMGRSDLHDSGGHPDRRLDGAISDEVRRWLRVDEVGRITRANGVTSTSAIPYCRAIRSSVLLCRTTLVTLAPTPTTPFRRKPPSSRQTDRSRGPAGVPQSRCRLVAGVAGVQSVQRVDDAAGVHDGPVDGQLDVAVPGSERHGMRCAVGHVDR